MAVKALGKKLDHMSAHFTPVRPGGAGSSKGREDSLSIALKYWYARETELRRTNRLSHKWPTRYPVWVFTIGVEHADS